MTREELEEYLKNGNLTHKFVLDLFDKVSARQSCNGCIHEPKKGENYPEECDSCCRWFGDRFERKDK